MSVLHLLAAPEPLIGAIGLMGLLLFVFAESGLLIGLFLPGDSLLFMAGVLSAHAGGFAPLWLVCVLTPVAAVAGDQIGYLAGRRVGARILDGRVGRWIGPGAVARTERFFREHGSRTITLARFVPGVRTLAPTMAAAAGMGPGRFVAGNAVGGFAWGVGIPLLGAGLGSIGLVRDHIELIVVGVVALRLAPVAGQVVAACRRPAASSAGPGLEARLVSDSLRGGRAMSVAEATR